MKNRYDSILRIHNQEILSLCPYNPLFFRELGLEVKRRWRKGARILEIGCGEGDSARHVLDLTKARLDLLDISPQIIKVCKKNLKRHESRVHYICQDAFEYLRSTEPYDIIFSAWTLHNFKVLSRDKLIKAIGAALRPEGAFILADKLYPGSKDKQLWMVQRKRYEQYLSAKVAKAIIRHEEEDISPIYRMDERQTVKVLKAVGFKQVTIRDRVERDVILVAEV